MGYVYIDDGHGTYTVGFYDPQGHWQAESDHGSATAARRRVQELNGTHVAALDHALIKEIALSFSRSLESLGEKLDQAIHLQRSLTRPSKYERRAFAVLHAAACLYRPTDLRPECVAEAVRIAEALLIEIERPEDAEVQS